MKFLLTPVDGAYLVDLEPHEDQRGSFARTFCQEEFQRQGLPTQIRQSNLSNNPYQGTLRGLHYQVEPHCEAKLIRVVRGRVYDVIVDLRKESPTFCQWFGTYLDDQECKAIFVPGGVAHGFLTLLKNTLIFYEMFEFHHPESARGIRYDDPLLDIHWPAEIKVISEKDQHWPNFQP